MRTAILVSTLPAGLASAADCTNAYNLRTIFQYPKPSNWLGNLAVRSNGSILTTDLLSPQVVQFNPFSADPKPQSIGPFSNVTGLTGITETIKDTFLVIGGNFKNESSQAQPGSLRLFTLQLNLASKPSISLTSDLSDIPLLNGLTTLTPSTVLGSDSASGAVWSIDAKSGSHKKVIQDPLMSPKPPSSSHSSSLGVNGLKIRQENGKSFLYFTNTAKGILAKIMIDPNDGTPATPETKATIVATNAAAAKGIGFDDFAFAPVGGVAFACNSRGNSISKVQIDGGSDQAIVAGNLNSSAVAEPSAAEFGRTGQDSHVLYISTAGGLGGPINGTARVGAQLLALDTMSPCNSTSFGKNGNGTGSGQGTVTTASSAPSSSAMTFTGSAGALRVAPSLMVLVLSMKLVQLF